MVTNTQIGGKWTWQEALGPLGPTGRPHKGAVWPPPSATLALATSPICGSYSTSSPTHWSKSVSTDGQDGHAMDPWAHCHRLGASPTDLPVKFHHVSPLQLPLGDNHRCWMLRWWNRGPSGALPWLLGAPLLLHCLSFGQHANKHKSEPSQVLVKSVSLAVWSKGKERMSRGSLSGDGVAPTPLRL
jgi:hypothetical protein